MSTINASGVLSFRYDNGNVQYTQGNGYQTIQDSDWPILVNNTDWTNTTLKVLFETDIIFDISNQQYFKCGSNNIQFGDTSLKSDGTRPVITLANKISNYGGLIENGNNIGDGKNNITVYNLIVDGSDSNQDGGAGWVCAAKFGRNSTGCYIINCSSKGNIYGGGIVGNLNSDSFAELIINNCSSIGEIRGGGGIAGVIDCGSVFIAISGCSSSGVIMGDSGGIVSSSSNCNTLIIKNCYSSGEIVGTNSGGIIGGNSSTYDDSYILIENCYSTGTISGTACGGIVGSGCGGAIPPVATGLISVINCFSYGEISLTCGGIYGSGASDSRLIENCYTSGLCASDSKIGIYASPDNDPATCYSEGDHGNSGIWSIINARSTLLGAPSTLPGVGAEWVSMDAIEFFLLRKIGYTPYTRSIISDNILVKTSNGSAAPGETTAETFISPDVSFSEILSENGGIPSNDITLNSNGTFSVNPSKLTGNYELVIFLV